MQMFLAKTSAYKHLITAMLTQNRHRPLLVSLLRRGSAIALITSVLAALALPRSAHAQEFTDTDVANYARAAVEIEAARQSAYEEASNILAAANSEADILQTRLSCDATRMRDMPDLSRPDKVDLRTALVNFCNDAREIADSHALTPQRFNRITQAHREDADLAERIQAEIAGLE